MIPAFDENGYLPAGVHGATVHEIAARFGTQSEIRRAQMESLRWLIDLARRMGCRRIIINGSFVTDIIEPNDVDVVILPAEGAPRDRAAAAEIEAGLPFLAIEVVDEAAFTMLVDRFFASDRTGVPKGMIEVLA